MNIKNILASSLGRPNSIKILAVLLVLLPLSRIAIAQIEERQIQFDSPTSKVVGVPISTTVKVGYTRLDKIIVDEFEKSAPVGQLLQDLTQSWYDLAKQSGATDEQATISTYLKLDRKLLDMEAQTKARLAVLKTF